MKVFAIILGLLAVVACASLGSGAPVNGRVMALQETVKAATSRNYVYPFKAGDRASVTVSGSGATYLGLYVFDPSGNCVAHDEGTRRNTCDDVAVEWYPPVAQRYTIQVKNFGEVTNTFGIAIR